jgi:replicative DNA helicase
MSNPLADLFNAQVEAEKALLGALIIDVEQLKKINTKPEEFRLVRHRWIFEAMQEACSRDTWEHIFISTIEILESRRKLKEVGGSAYITGLITYCDDSQRAVQYAYTIREWAMKKSLVDKANELVKAAFSIEPIPDDMKRVFFG